MQKNRGKGRKPGCGHRRCAVSGQQYFLYEFVIPAAFPAAQGDPLFRELMAPSAFRGAIVGIIGSIIVDDGFSVRRSSRLCNEESIFRLLHGSSLSLMVRSRKIVEEVEPSGIFPAEFRFERMKPPFETNAEFSSPQITSPLVREFNQKTHHRTCISSRARLHPFKVKFSANVLDSVHLHARFHNS